MSGALPPALVDRIAAVERALRRRTALRAGAAGLGVGALLALATGPAPGLAVGALAALVGYGWPVDRRAAVGRLDAAAGLDGALRCAWDHRDATDPMAAAQRRRAAADLDAAPAARAVPRPSPAWALAPLLWIAPLAGLGGPVEPAPADRPEAPRADGPLALGAAREAADPPEAAPDPVADDPAARARAGDTPPDAGPADGAPADGGEGGAPTAIAERGAIGREAGDRAGGGAGATDVPLAAADGAPGLTLPVARGSLAPGDGPTGRVVVGRTPPPPDAIADPARPYPTRYRRAIAAWFDRRP